MPVLNFGLSKEDSLSEPLETGVYCAPGLFNKKWKKYNLEHHLNKT